MYNGEKLKHIRDAIKHTLEKAYPDTGVKVTILRTKPWWKFWK